MQLTNYSAIDLRHGSTKVLNDRDHMIRRIQTGDRLMRTSDDPGAVAVANKLGVENRQRSAMRENLQNARTYLEMQGIGLQKVHDVYERMSVLATRALDVTLTDQDREDLDVEFQELTFDLDRILSEKFNGVRLFNQNVKCGGVQNIPLGELNLTSASKPAGVSHAVRSQTLDVQAPGGTLTFRVNSGGAADSYRIYMGGQEVFSAGSAFQGPDATVPIYDDPPGFGFVQDGWKTSGSANDGDADTFKVTFGPGKPTTYEVTLGASNVGLFANQDQLVANGGVIRTADISSGSSNTNLTLQLETTTIGRIYDDVSFEPQSEDATVTLDENGATMTMTAKGFSTMSGYDIKTAANAEVALAKILGDDHHVGEADCVLYERLGAVRSEASRLDAEINKLADDLVSGEAAQGRVADLDYAQEMTRFATNTMQLNVMTSSMATANRATDVLMPLTTQQYNSAVTQRFQLF